MTKPKLRPVDKPTHQTWEWEPVQLFVAEFGAQALADAMEIYRRLIDSGEPMTYLAGIEDASTPDEESALAALGRGVIERKYPSFKASESEPRERVERFADAARRARRARTA